MNVVQRNLLLLRKQLDLPNMCSALLEKSVISVEEEDEISTRKTQTGTFAARDLLLKKMLGKGKASHLVFVEALVEYNQDLAGEVALAEERRAQTGTGVGVMASNAGLSRPELVLRALRSAVDNDFVAQPVPERAAAASVPLQCSEDHSDASVAPKQETRVTSRDPEGVPLPSFLPLQRRDFLRGMALDPWDTFVQPHFFTVVTSLEVPSLVAFCFASSLLTSGEKVRILNEEDDMKRRDSLLQSLFHTHWLGFQTVMAELEVLPHYRNVVELVSETLRSACE